MSKTVRPDKITGKGEAGPAPRAWQRMLSGRRLDLLDPSPLDIEIEDIAHGLARVARWNGQTSGAHAFSVAQHTLLVEDIAGRLDPGISLPVRLLTLVHDGPEYVIGDMITPFKAILGETYKAVEARLQDAIHIRYGLRQSATPDAMKLIKRADRVSAFLEATQLAGFDPDEAADIFGRPGVIGGADLSTLFRLSPWPAEEAEARFLARFHALDQALEQATRQTKPSAAAKAATAGPAP
jgi:5'-deoxynucleotidase YfbR-like HD superfamily hydrolase